MTIALPISPLVCNYVPTDVKLKYLSYLGVDELCKSGQVCQEWFLLSRDKVFWVPIYKELNPYSQREFVIEGGNLGSEVLGDLQKNQKNVNLILSLCDQDTALSFLIDGTSLDSLNLDKMLPIERTLRIMRELRKGCTQLFINIL